jgi:hypothetical protein
MKLDTIGKTGYSQHVLNTLDVMDVHAKGPYLNTLERYHIYKSRKEGLVFIELQFGATNPIFDIVN